MSQSIGFGRCDIRFLRLGNKRQYGFAWWQSFGMCTLRTQCQYARSSATMKLQRRGDHVETSHRDRQSCPQEPWPCQPQLFHLLSKTHEGIDLKMIIAFQPPFYQKPSKAETAIPYWTLPKINPSVVLNHYVWGVNLLCRNDNRITKRRYTTKRKLV